MVLPRRAALCLADKRCFLVYVQELLLCSCDNPLGMIIGHDIRTIFHTIKSRGRPFQYRLYNSLLLLCLRVQPDYITHPHDSSLFQSLYVLLHYKTRIIILHHVYILKLELD